MNKRIHDNSLMAFFGWAPLLASIISASLMIIAPSNTGVWIVNIFLALVITANPVYFLPLILVSSISSSIAIFECFAAVFFYIVLCIGAMLVKSKFRLFVSRAKYCFFLAVFCFWMLYCGLNSMSGTFYVSLRLVILIVSLWLCSVVGKDYREQSTKAFLDVAPVCIIVSLVKLVFWPEIFIIEGTYVSSYRTTIAESINPNQFALFIAILSVILFINGLRRKNLFHIVSFVLALAVLYIVKSRTSFFGTVGLCGLYCLSSLKIKKPLKILYGVVAFALVIFLAVKPNDNYNTTSEDRQLSVSSIISDSGSGRFLTWLEAFSVIIPNHPLSGIGIGKENYEALGFSYDSDNLYIDLLAETGVIGFVVFFCFYISLISAVKKKSKGKTPIIYYLLWLQLVSGIGETVFDSQLFWCVIMLCLIYLRSATDISSQNVNYILKKQ